MTDGSSNSQARDQSRRQYFRYRVDDLGAALTPLASAVAFYGELRLKILNISLGGAALLPEGEMTGCNEGDVVRLSVSIRDRAFPIQVELRCVRGQVMHCAFVEPPPIFLGALREFLKPKFLGTTLQRNIELSARPDAMSLIDGAQNYEAFTGQNETAVFLWTREDKSLLKLVVVSGELLLEWSLPAGVKTGRSQRDELDKIEYDRNPDAALMHYFADILISWFNSDVGTAFVERLMGSFDSLNGVLDEDELPVLRLPDFEPAE